MTGFLQRVSIFTEVRRFYKMGTPTISFECVYAFATFCSWCLLTETFLSVFGVHYDCECNSSGAENGDFQIVGFTDYIHYLDELTAGLQRVLFVRGGGAETLTSDAWCWCHCLSWMHGAEFFENLNISLFIMPFCQFDYAVFRRSWKLSLKELRVGGRRSLFKFVADLVMTTVFVYVIKSSFLVLSRYMDETNEQISICIHVIHIISVFGNFPPSLSVLFKSAVTRARYECLRLSLKVTGRLFRSFPQILFKNISYAV